MMAREKFQKGDKIKLSKKGIESRGRCHNGCKLITGVVTGYSKGFQGVRILRNRCKMEETWHMDYLEKV